MLIRVVLYVLAAFVLETLTIPANAAELKGWLREGPDYPQYQGLVAFFDRLKANSQGRYTGTILCCKELGSQKDVVPKFKAGQVDVALFYSSAFGKEIPEMDIFALPFIFRNPDQMMRALNGDVGKKMAQLMAKQGYEVLTWYDGGARSFYSRNKLMPYASDFKNQKIRVPQKKAMLSMLEALGAKPSTLAFNKMTDAFKNGELDAGENDLTSYYTSEQYKVAPYFTFTYHLVQPIAVVISEQRWKALSAEDKAIFRKSAAESAVAAAKLRAQRDADLRAKLEKAGVKFGDFLGATTIVSEMNQTYKPVIVSEDATDIMMKIMTTPTH